MLLIIFLSTDYALTNAFEKNILTLKHGLLFGARIFFHIRTHLKIKVGYGPFTISVLQQQKGIMTHNVITGVIFLQLNNMILFMKSLEACWKGTQVHQCSILIWML